MFSDGSHGLVDCFWPGAILVEMKFAPAKSKRALTVTADDAVG